MKKNNVLLDDLGGLDDDGGGLDDDDTGDSGKTDKTNQHVIIDLTDAGLTTEQVISYHLLDCFCFLLRVFRCFVCGVLFFFKCVFVGC